MAEHRHISEQFESELRILQNKFATMGGLVESQIRHAIQAFKEMDLELAKEVRREENQVNQFEVEVDQETTTIIARRQPAASDLRLLVGLLRSSTDLERIGDEADRIAKILIKGRPFSLVMPELVSILPQFTELGELVRRMLREALDLFARHDESGVRATIEMDRLVDSVYNDVVDACTEGMAAHPSHVLDFMSVIWVARSLERVGDHAKNIAENVIYSVRGEDIRHPSLQHTSE